MRVTLHPGAEADLAEAAGFYETQASPVLAARFVAEFKRVAGLLLDNPGLGSSRSRGRRSYPLRLFPFAVIYRQIDDGVVILIVRHHRRHPGHGERRS
jgi:plasmid stabilization system protein ParE